MNVFSAKRILPSTILRCIPLDNPVDESGSDGERLVVMTMYVLQKGGDASDRDEKAD